jgi:rhamnogalacturonyl hydrolase YesR
MSGVTCLRGLGARRIPFGWSATELKADQPLPFVGATPTQDGPALFRFAVAADDRSPRRELVLRVAGGGEVLARADVRYAPIFQSYLLEVSGADMTKASQCGVDLVSNGSSDSLWLLSDTREEAPDLELGWIRETRPGARMDFFYQRLRGLETIQPFGWMEGCVLDGLVDLSVATGDKAWCAVIQRRFDLFFDTRGDLSYENHRGVTCENMIYGVEGLLPMATLARLHASHPALGLVGRFVDSRLKSYGAVRDGGELTAEGCYTVAYPLAVMARMDPKWVDIVLSELRIRHKLLRHGGAIYLRYHDDGSKTFRWWARGVAWFLLGTIRALRELGQVPDDLRESISAEARRVIDFQRPDGLWGSYLDASDVAADSSGSAGIGAALALGAQMGILGPDAACAAQRCWVGLQSHLTSDGFLSGATQVNRGGEILQRSDYRVISQYAMGLMAQLAAVVACPSRVVTGCVVKM